MRIHFVIPICLAAPPLLAQSPAPRVVLNEVHFHPYTEKEDERNEFVEILNSGDAAAGIGGWKFTKGIAYTFPPDTQLAAGGFLVVARNPTTLQAAFGIDAALIHGPFQGELSNGGEEIVLEDGSGKVVDSFRYQERFPWPIAPDGYGAVEGKGYSLERRCPTEPTDSVANWAASAKDAPTPGAANGQAGCDLPPIVLELSLDPVTVKRSDTPVLSVAVSRPEKVLSAQVEYFIDDPQKTGEPTVKVPLLDDGTGGDPVAGDGVFSMTFPSANINSVVRYRVLIDAGAGLAPAYPRPEDPFAWEAYFVDPGITTRNTLYHIFVSRANWAKMESNIGGGRLAPAWNDEVPAVLVSGGVVYDIALRYGGSTFNRTNGRSAPFTCTSYTSNSVVVKSLHMIFPRWRPLRGDTNRIEFRKEWVSGFTGYHDRLSYFLFDLVKVPAPRTRWAKVYMNGCYYHFFCELEVPDDTLMGRYFDQVGDLFKSVGYVGDQGPFYWGDERVIPPGGGYSAVQRYQYTYDRKTHTWKVDHTALIKMIEGLNKARAQGLPALRDYLVANFDVEECLNYLATVNYIVPWDDMWQNHYLYQRADDGKWMWMAWDLDQTWGGPCCCADVSATSSIYRGANRTDVGNRSNWWSYLKDSFFIAMPDEYLARVIDLVNNVYPPAVIDAEIDRLSAELGTEADVVPVGSWGDSPRQMEAIVRKFVTDRQKYINSQLVAAKLGAALRVKPGDTVDFDTTGSKPPLGPQVSYTWSNGMTGDHPSAVFNEAGAFEIKLTVTYLPLNVSTTASRIVRVVGTTEPPFVEDGGLLSIEAEHPVLNIALDPVDQWVAVSDNPGFSGSGYLTSKGTTKFTKSGYGKLAPEVVYPIRFTTPGSHRLWLRSRAPNASLDTVMVALDGVEVPVSRYFQSPLGADFAWSTGLAAAGPFDFDAAAGGSMDHLLSIFVRETGVEVDKIVLAADSTYAPDGLGPPESARASIGPGHQFVRGDANGDGKVDISDPVALVESLFVQEGGIPCQDAADSNDDGVLDITDAVFTLAFLFLAGEPMPAPYPDPGLDPTPEDPFTCGDPAPH